MTTTALPHPVMPAIRKAALGVLLLATACAGVWHGTGLLVHHYDQPDTTVSYATPDTVRATLTGAWHTPAKQGAFRDDASIQTPDVISVVQVVTAP